MTQANDYLEGRKGRMLPPFVFDRDEKLEDEWYPKTVDEYNSTVESASWQSLKKMGFRKWGEVGNDIVILFPHEWYQIIPEGATVYGISGEPFVFESDKNKCNRRFGCLAYGLRKPKDFFKE